MRKHRSFKHEQTELKEPKNKAGMYMAVFIAAVMILSIGGVFLSNPDSESDYTFNGYNFKSSNNLWITKIDGKETAFYFLPEQVANLNVSEQALTIIKNSQGLIVTSNSIQDPESRLQALDIFKLDFTNAYLKAYPNKKAGIAFTQKAINSRLPVLTCDNSTYLFPVISVDFSNETNIKVDKDYCIIVSAADEYSLLSLLDNLRYRILDILK